MVLVWKISNRTTETSTGNVKYICSTLNLPQAPTVVGYKLTMLFQVGNAQCLTSVQLTDATKLSDIVHAAGAACDGTDSMSGHHYDSRRASQSRDVTRWHLCVEWEPWSVVVIKYDSGAVG